MIDYRTNTLIHLFRPLKLRLAYIQGDTILITVSKTAPTAHAKLLRKILAAALIVQEKFTACPEVMNVSDALYDVIVGF